MKVKVFSMLFISVVFVFIFVKTVSAQVIELSPTIPISTPTAGVETVDYQLPYPGLLPDNPLYVFKAARDKVVEFLISDPVKKAEFYLLSSDKRVNTGYYLIIKGKHDMGMLYISKSNSYLSLANSAIAQSGENGKSIRDRLGIAVKKHIELLNSLKKKIDKKNSTKLSIEIKRLEKFQTLINKK
jgi:hypothetical protein